MPFPQIDPVAFAIGPFAIHWYALGWLAGVALGVAYGMTLLKRRSLWVDNIPPMTPSELLDFSFWILIGIVIGGRLGYVLFYDPGHYLANPLEIVGFTPEGFALRGLSFHGGLIGLMVAMIAFTWRKGANVLSGLDLLACCGTIGIFLVRIANFINSELYGAPTELPWGVVFPTDPLQVPRHPSQLYEAVLEGLVLFIVIRVVTHNLYGLRRPGLVAGIFGIGYAVSRIAVEFVRLPDAHIGYLYGGWLTMGQVLSLPILLGGIALVVLSARRRHGR